MPIGPTPSELQTLKDLEKDIAALKEDLARAKRAGIDVAELEAALVNADALRKGILKEYTPKTRGAATY